MSDAKETGQTVQESTPKARPPFFEVAQDPETKKWHWVLWSANGRRMATNDIEYDRRKDAIGAIEVFVKAVPLTKHIVEASGE